MEFCLKVPQLLVLAGGFGTRLKPLIPNVPKPLAPILNEPFVYYFIKNWERQGINKFIFLLHYNSQMIKDYIINNCKEQFSNNSEFSFVVENEPLGTAGAIKNAIIETGINGSFLVANSDTWVGNCLDLILESGCPSIAVIYLNNNDRYGSITIKKNIIVSFEEKTKNNKITINAGIYYLHSDYFYNLKKGFLSIEKDLFPDLVSKQKLKPVYLDTEFVDIGIPKDYIRFLKWIKNNKKKGL